MHRFARAALDVAAFGLVGGAIGLAVGTVLRPPAETAVVLALLSPAYAIVDVDGARAAVREYVDASSGPRFVLDYALCVSCALVIAVAVFYAVKRVTTATIVAETLADGATAGAGIAIAQWRAPVAV